MSAACHRLDGGNTLILSNPSSIFRLPPHQKGAVFFLVSNPESAAIHFPPGFF
jgi:hypothetical protein